MFTVLVIALATGVLVFLARDALSPLPAGEVVLSENGDKPDASSSTVEDVVAQAPALERTSTRQVLVTNGTKHSIPLNEILSGGPAKDGIPSIDDPKFIAVDKASFLNNDDPGIGITVGGESRFYPYRILVWHEIVNDTIAGKPVLVTYCPLCATGIAFDRRVAGKEQEFGVSGRLWQSNLLMYNRASREEDESLWSQVLGEAVVGPNTGEKLKIIPSEITRFSEWKAAHTDTLVLSRDTGALRTYGLDPYGDYYTSESVSFGASFSDTRLHPKALVHGIEIDGKYKAYDDAAITAGGIQDTFAGNAISAERLPGGGVRFTAGGEGIAHVTGFWFSWLAVHPETELFK